MATATAKKPAAKKTAAPKTTAVATRNMGAVTSVAEMEKELALMAEKTSSQTQPAGGNQLRVTQGKQFVFPDGTKADEVTLVVVDFTSFYRFYEGAYDPKNIASPICWAINPVPAQLAPSSKVPQPQADTCAECPMNVFGSAGAGKACKNGRRLAVLPATDDADMDTPMLLLDTSPTSIKAFDAFVTSVRSTYNKPPMSVTVTIGFDDKVDFPRLVFTDINPNPDMALAFNRRKEAADMLAVEPDPSAFEKPAEGAKPAARAAAKPVARPPVKKAVKR